MDNNNIYERLAKHISFLSMGYPPTEALEEILRENLSPVEVEAVLAIPNRVIPLQPESFANISKRSDLPENELKVLLDGLAGRGLIFSGKTDEGKTGYAFQQLGFSFPQTFFWRGEDTPQSRKMAGLVAKYFNRKVTKEAYLSDTNAYRYIPVSGTITLDKQAVLPHHTMESVVEKAVDFALCHCSCRMIAALVRSENHGDCIIGAFGNTYAAADTPVHVDYGFVVGHFNGINRTDINAFTATDTFLLRVYEG